MWWRLIIGFLRIGVFTIGGGYALLPLIQKEVVGNGWLNHQEFLNVLAISEVTPGPLSVNAATFVGYRIGGFWGAIVATTSLVIPSFLLIMLAGDTLRRWMGQPRVAQFFMGIRPAVTGTMAGAAVLLARRVFFSQEATRLMAIDGRAILIAIGSFGLIKKKIHPILALGLAGLAGWILY